MILATEPGPTPDRPPHDWSFVWESATLALLESRCMRRAAPGLDACLDDRVRWHGRLEPVGRGPSETDFESSSTRVDRATGEIRAVRQESDARLNFEGDGEA